MEEDLGGSSATTNRDRKKRKRPANASAAAAHQPAVQSSAVPTANPPGAGDADDAIRENPDPARLKRKKSKKNRKKQRPIDPKPAEIPESGEKDGNSSDDDDDDEFLQREAAAWAARCAPTGQSQAPRDSPEAAETSRAPGSSAGAAEQPWSVHITQIAFTATQLDLQHHFAKSGCLVSSVRMVYDKGIEKSREFRGVAFVDFADEESFRGALQLNKSTLLGRKINVRPTKSTHELSSIVQQTREKVAHKIRSSKEQQDQEKATKKIPPAPQKGSPTKAKAPTVESPTLHAKGERKLTKKERNRRAAILRQRGKHGGR